MQKLNSVQFTRYMRMALVIPAISIDIYPNIYKKKKRKKMVKEKLEKHK